jgi:SAM-dependent methyltransferase
MSGDAFAEFERAGWERAASRYEECWTDTVLFVEALLDAASVRAGSRLLDVACGPGFVSEAAAARGAQPVGVDVATAMVERARLRCPDLTFVVGDALRLPFADASFDAVTMNFGILHVSQPERALAEAHRVLVPDGRLAFTSWVAQGNAEDEITEAALAEQRRTDRDRAGLRARQHGLGAAVSSARPYRSCGRAASRTSPRSAPIRRTADTESRSIGTAWPPLPVFGSRCRDSSGMRRPSLVTSSTV